MKQIVLIVLLGLFVLVACEEPVPFHRQCLKMTEKEERKFKETPACGHVLKVGVVCRKECMLQPNILYEYEEEPKVPQRIIYLKDLSDA